MITEIWREYTNYETSLKEDESWDITVKQLQKEDIAVVQTEYAFIKGKLACQTDQTSHNIFVN